MSKHYHAYFSQKQKKAISKMYNRSGKKMYEKNHTNIYLTTGGKEVKITEVSENILEHEKYFTDSIYLGVVTKWIRVCYD
tara:strand:- start:150 stop:389 length:240 start_codon:yes stop_codon:yes gene_type:complete